MNDANATSDITSPLPAPGLDFTGAKITAHQPAQRVRTWTGAVGTVTRVAVGMCNVEERVYAVRIDGESVVHEWSAWMLTGATGGAL